MYTENYGSDYDSYDNKRRGFPLKDFILKLILIIIFVLLLMWLIPWPNNNALTSRIFNQNIQEMKDASLLYYTVERLPKNVGDKKTLTLQEMLDLKLLLPFTDKDGKACDTENSYVTIEKLKTEYMLKAFLKCSDQEDYILVHVGCYDYCSTYLCETKDPANDKPIFRPSAPTKPSLPKPKPTPTPDKPTPKPDKPTPEKPDPKPEPPTPTENYIYEYKKEEVAHCAGWSDWKVGLLPNGTRTPSSDAKYQAEYLGEFLVQIGEVRYTTTATYYKPVEVGRKTYQVCSNYTYESINNSSYRITSNWKETGVVYGQTVIPAPTATKRYVPIRLRYDICLETCTHRPVFDLRVEERTAVKTSSNESQVSGCGTWTTKSIPIIENKTYTEEFKHVEPKYGTVRKFQDRVCTSWKDATATLKWSTYGDKTLLNQGYYYTGNKKKA